MTNAWIEDLAKERLEELYEHEKTIARSAHALVARLPAGPTRDAVAEIEESATTAAESLLEALHIKDHPPSRGLIFEATLVTASTVSLDAALWLLDVALRRQDRRFREALAVLDAEAQYAVLVRARPRQLRAHQRLCAARGEAPPSGLHVST